MNILEICSARQIGGGETHLIQLVDELRRRGHHVEVAGTKGGPVPYDHAVPFRKAMGLGAAVALRRILKGRAFDVVHAHVARDYPLAAAALIGMTSPRLVLTRHLLHPVRRNPLYRRVDGWIVTTQQIETVLASARPRRLAVIPNWVDSARFRYSERPVRDPVVIGLLGQIAPHKGHDDAIAMMERLGPGFRLLLGGEGKAEYVRSLEERARALPVEFPGFVDAESFLGAIDVLILPSWEEAFGIALLEAMAAGVNVIASRSGGPPEILDHGRSGMLVPPRDPDALADAVRKLVADPERALSLRRAARARVQEHYDLGPTVARTEAFFLSLLDETRGPARARS